MGRFTFVNTTTEKPLVKFYYNYRQPKQKPISEEISKGVSIVSVTKVLISMIHCLPVHR